MVELRANLISRSFITQMIKFAIVGALGTLVNISILYILTEIFNIYYIISEIFAFFISGLNNYIFNKIWTFSENLEAEAIKKYFKFIIISLISLLVNLGVLFILVEVYLIWYIYAEIGAIFCAFLINFFGNKVWTFNNKTEK